MADEIKKTIDEVKENTANTQEGVIPDDAGETAAGGEFYFGTPWVGDAPRKSVKSDHTLKNRLR